MSGVNHFGVVDYIVVSGTFLFSLFIGVYYAVISKQTNEDLLVGGRNMGSLPIAASMLVTYLSAITVLGYPAEIYTYGVQIFMMTILSVFYIPISTYLFISVFYKMKLTSVYKYLELRFESVVVRWLASFTFILQVLLLNGIVLYAPSIALETIVGVPMWMSIIGIGVCGTIYTSIGGLKAVVWTDVFQFFMIIAGMLAIVIKGIVSAGGITSAFSIAGEKGRLDLFDLTVDPFQRHNTLNFVLGYGFSALIFFGTHQPQVQRYCSLPTFSHVVKAIALSIPLRIFTMGMVVLTGVSIFATFSGCDPILLGKIQKSDQIVPYFVAQQLSFIPGMMGLFVACIFSAVLSTISSTLNSLAAVTWEDFLSKIHIFEQMGDRAQAMTTRIVSVLYGILSILLAFVAQYVGTIFQAAMTAVGATSGALGGIFFMGLFMPCVNKFGAIMGMLAGLSVMMFIGVESFIMAKTIQFNPKLPIDIANCPEGTDFSTAINATTYNPPNLEWPDKLFTLSYIMYSFCGSLITISVGLVASIISGGICQSKQVSRKYLHPLMHRYTCCNGSENEDEASTHKSVATATASPPHTKTASNSYVSYPYKYETVPSLPNRSFDRTLKGRARNFISSSPTGTVTRVN